MEVNTGCSPVTRNYILCSPSHLCCLKELLEEKFENKLREVDEIKMVVVVVAVAASVAAQ
jgi:hypothetical protein